MSGRVYFFCELNSPLHYFHFERLDGTPKLADSYALRFKVYCSERGFLPESAYPDGQEIDEYDARSSHFAAFHRDGDLAGTARLVHGALETLPLSHKCEVDPAALPADIDTRRVAEISRLAVSRAFRRRVMDGLLPDIKQGVTDSRPAAAQRRRNCPELVLGLYKILYHHSKREGIEYWFAAMEGSLAKLLNRFHFEFRPVGPEIDYYGPVRPYVASLSELEAAVAKNAPELFRAFMQGLEPEFLPPIARK
jgi:N-acyl amino acid synthase of PEP-CTERM/exosortase system